MKNTTKHFCIAALAAVMVFAMTACDTDGKRIPVKVRSYNNNGAAPPQSSIAGNVQTMNFMPFSDDDESFEPYKSFYDSLGSHVRYIDATKFILRVSNIELYLRDGGGIVLNGGSFDFANGVTLTAGDIPEDAVITALIFPFDTIGGSGLDSSSIVEFEWPGGKDAFDVHQFVSPVFHPTEMPWYRLLFTPVWNGDKVTILTSRVDLYSLSNMLLGLEEINPVSDVGWLEIIAYGTGINHPKLYNKQAAPLNDLILNHDGPGGVGGSELGGSGVIGGSVVAIPFSTPITVPSSASSVTFHLSWNLKGLISQYDNNTPDDPTDDIFVLSDGWWNGLFIYADIQ